MLYLKRCATLLLAVLHLPLSTGTAEDKSKGAFKGYSSFKDGIAKKSTVFFIFLVAISSDKGLSKIYILNQNKGFFFSGTLAGNRINEVTKGPRAAIIIYNTYLLKLSHDGGKINSNNTSLRISCPSKIAIKNINCNYFVR
jgi:hypothetical protein